MENKNLILIGFSDESRLRQNYVKWSGKYLNDILEASSEEVYTSGLIKKGIGYYAKGMMREVKCMELDITKVILSEESLVLNYRVIKESELESGAVTKVIRKVMHESDKGLNNFPFCIPVEESRLQSAMDDEELRLRIAAFKAKNDWLSMYSYFSPIEKLSEKPNLWNDPSVLDSISFACAKLSEVYINLNHAYPDVKCREEFLQKQKKYRGEAIRLRERCIELNPKKATYHSNLAYTYYQSLRELTARGGRRDGSIKMCIENCLKHLNDALKSDPCRIADLYRMGHVKLFFAKSKLRAGIQKYSGDESATRLMTQAIESFQDAEIQFENLEVIEESRASRYNKEYIKSLYNIASSYGELQFSDRDYIKHFISYADESENKIQTYNTRYFDKALYYIEKCIMKDRKLSLQKEILTEAIDAAGYDGVVCGVYKLYSFGKFLFQKYIYLSNIGCDESSEARDALAGAEVYLKKALSKKFPDEISKQSKGFIAERLSRLYIAKGDYSGAVEVLKSYIRARTDYYIRYTYATALYKCGKTGESCDQFRLALESGNSNKSQWQGWFLKSCTEIRENRLADAGRSMDEAIKAAARENRRNMDSIYIARAFISYRMDLKDEVIKFLESAYKINPRREALKRRLKLWKDNFGDFDLCKLR